MSTGQPCAPIYPRDIYGYTLFPGMLETQLTLLATPCIHKCQQTLFNFVFYTLYPHSTPPGQDPKTRPITTKYLILLSRLRLLFSSLYGSATCVLIKHRRNRHPLYLRDAFVSGHRLNTWPIIIQ